ncbi:hypothetical protein VE02_08317 [Pseudogymnoascus sp. 03VT05]|nr:hypothetical protein VE02_08317 [Pseudogymnoascus sp. 03VT05]
MPPRRSHKKSRAGCQRCKLRKVKCDEAHPICGNCTKHGVPCDFDDPLALSPPTPTLAWGDTPPAALAWQLAVPNLAFTTPCLMDALLAIAALHLRALTPSDPSLPRLFHAYMASALSSYTATLHSGVTAENGPALFATAALIAFQASASRRFLNEPGSEVEPYSLPTQWFHAFQGVKTVVIATWPFLRSSDIRPIISAQPALALDLHPSRPAFFDDLLVGLDEHADPRALAVIASFFAMTRAVDGAWWLSGVARKEVRGILGLLGEEWRGRIGGGGMVEGEAYGGVGEEYGVALD